ncbi:MAG: S-layer homology domain-containing protein [Acidobacteriota bacterium]
MRTALVGVAMFAWQLAAPVAADDFRGVKPDLPAWGTTDIEYNLSAYEFFPLTSTGGYTTFYADRWAGPGPGLHAVAHLPSGARLSGLYLRGCDLSAAADMTLTLDRCSFVGGTICEAVASVSSSGSPGCSGWGTTTFTDPTISNFLYSYVASWMEGTAGSDLRIRQAEFYYQLQVSPAPGTATFADVPTSHPFFQYVEALVASGITAGCGGGNYCPDAALTRGQMAVFLSKALGLHWAP